MHLPAGVLLSLGAPALDCETGSSDGQRRLLGPRSPSKPYLRSGFIGNSSAGATVLIARRPQVACTTILRHGRRVRQYSTFGAPFFCAPQTFRERLALPKEEAERDASGLWPLTCIAASPASSCHCFLQCRKGEDQCGKRHLFSASC